MVDDRLKQHYHPSRDELDWSVHTIKELSSLPWASKLTKELSSFVNHIAWIDSYNLSYESPQWLDVWNEIDQYRTRLFEARFAYDLHLLGIEPVYEKKLLGKSSVDFFVDKSKPFAIELVSANQSDQLTKDTELFFTQTGKKGAVASWSPDTEFLMIQNKIVGKVAKRLSDGSYIPNKFPSLSDFDGFNVILADTRAFSAGMSQLSESDKLQLAYGKEGLLDYPEAYPNFFNGKHIAGLFDTDKPGTEAQLFRERIHILCLVSESEYGENKLLSQIQLYPNRLLENSNEAAECFSKLLHLSIDSKVY